MRLLYAPERHEQHRASWILVIQLNVISAVRLLLDIHEALAERDAKRYTAGSSEGDDDDNDDAVTGSALKPHDPVLLARLRLAPLIACEVTLRRALGAIDEETHVNEKVDSRGRKGPVPTSPGFSHSIKLKAGWQTRAMTSASKSRGAKVQDIIESTDDDDKVTRAIPSYPVPSWSPRTQFGRRDSLPLCDNDPFPQDQDAQPHTPTSVVYDRRRTESMLLSMQGDVQALWQRDTIRLLKSKGRLPTFMVHFLDHLHRIAAPGYSPSDQDILEARVRTIGITEETFKISSATYRVVDVGGSRSQRNVWTSFFDQATAIILLAPISAFDQTLAEDRRINRLVDSLDILESIVDCKLLARVSLILFLNKSDICEKKLLQGAQVKRFFPEYTGSNDFEHVWRWFREKFRAVVHKHVSRVESSGETAHANL